MLLAPTFMSGFQTFSPPGPFLFLPSSQVAVALVSIRAALPGVLTHHWCSIGSLAQVHSKPDDESQQIKQKPPPIP